VKLALHHDNINYAKHSIDQQPELNGTTQLSKHLTPTTLNQRLLLLLLLMMMMIVTTGAKCCKQFELF